MTKPTHWLALDTRVGSIFSQTLIQQERQLALLVTVIVAAWMNLSANVYLLISSSA